MFIQLQTVYWLVEQGKNFPPKSKASLSGHFVDYFIQKIVTVCNGLYHCINTDNQYKEADVLSSLELSNPATNQEVLKSFRSSALYRQY